MATWVYVLQDRGKFFYVGVTKRLLQRLKEHCSIRGGSYATSVFDYDSLVGIYKIGDDDMKDTERRKYEDRITLQLMKLHRNGPGYVRGGRWTLHYHYDFEEPADLSHTDMPVICNCKLPAASFLSKTGFRFFCCPRKHMSWLTRDESFPMKYSDPCDFFVPEWKAHPAAEPNRCSTCNQLCGPYRTCFKHSFYMERQNIQNSFVVVDSD